MLEDMKDRVRGYREVGRSVLVSRGEGESDFQRVHTFYEQMLATVSSFFLMMFMFIFELA